MPNHNTLDVFSDKQKAIDHCMWLNFKYRIADITFGVIEGSRREWIVLSDTTAEAMETSFLDVLPKDYSQLSSYHMMTIQIDDKPLWHWKTILELFSTTDSEILHYIMYSQLSLERLIRHELARRGYDQHYRWINKGAKALEVWNIHD